MFLKRQLTERKAIQFASFARAHSATERRACATARMRDGASSEDTRASKETRAVPLCVAVVLCRVPRVRRKRASGAATAAAAVRPLSRWSWSSCSSTSAAMSQVRPMYALARTHVEPSSNAS
eukprot:4545429-Pleurochrysis_carterae.AAC.1